ncbi:MAG: hypothetical protein V3S32_03675 [Acidimicrobiia bacterium]
MRNSHELEAIVRRAWQAVVDQDAEAHANILITHPDARAILTADDEWIRPHGHFFDLMARGFFPLTLRKPLAL